MFGQNEIVGKKFFADAEDRLLVTSMFLTLQGEGPFQGQPALFIRLAKCNLNCSFCDTFFDQGDWYTIQDLLDSAYAMIDSKYSDTGQCGIVITGGEPSLQANIAQFANRAMIYTAFVQIESNGILAMPEDLHNNVCVVISPKCSEKTSNYLAPLAANVYRASCLKFVLSADPNSPYHTVPDWAFKWKDEFSIAIYVSPMNIYREKTLEAVKQRMKDRSEHNIQHRSTIDEVVSAWDDSVLDREANRINHAYAFKYAADKGLFLTLQMHLFGAAA